MEEMSLAELAGVLRTSKVFVNKSHIRTVSDTMKPLAQAWGIINGDDAAAIAYGEEYLLLAAEGIIPELVRRDPHLAGRAAVLANINDIYAMGGRPLAMVDVIGTTDDRTAREICRGIRDNAARFQVPVVGGHLLRTESDFSVALAILGRAKRLITSFDAQPGDRMLLITNMQGVWLSENGFWNCTLEKDDAMLVPNLELLPRASEAGLVRAGKDVSMSGISGTVLMLAECSGLGARLDLDRIIPPPGVDLIPWLLAYLSYGFLLAAPPERVDELATLFLERKLSVTDIGAFCQGSRVLLARQGEEMLLWDWNKNPFTGFTAPKPGTSGRPLTAKAS